MTGKRTQHPSTVDIVQDWFNYRDIVVRLEKEYQDAIKMTVINNITNRESQESRQKRNGKL